MTEGRMADDIERRLPARHAALFKEKRMNALCFLGQTRVWPPVMTPLTTALAKGCLQADNGVGYLLNKGEDIGYPFPPQKRIEQSGKPAIPKLPFPACISNISMENLE